MYVISPNPILWGFQQRQQKPGFFYLLFVHFRPKLSPIALKWKQMDEYQSLFLEQNIIAHKVQQKIEFYALLRYSSSEFYIMSCRLFFL